MKFPFTRKMADKIKSETGQSINSQFKANAKAIKRMIINLGITVVSYITKIVIYYNETKSISRALSDAWIDLVIDLIGMGLSWLLGKGLAFLAKVFQL